MFNQKHLNKFSLGSIAKALFLNYHFDPDLAICAVFACRHKRLMGDKLNYYLGQFERTRACSIVTEKDAEEILKEYTEIRHGKE